MSYSECAEANERTIGMDQSEGCRTITCIPMDSRCCSAGEMQVFSRCDERGSDGPRRSSMGIEKSDLEFGGGRLVDS